MKVLLSILFCIFCCSVIKAQSAIICGILKDSVTSESIAGVYIKTEPAAGGTKSGTDGYFKIKGLKPGRYVLVCSAIGFEKFRSEPIVVSAGDSVYREFFLHPEAAEIGEVVVTGTRTQRSIADVPVRVEAIPEEEIEEKIMMDAASVSMALSETPGLRVQTTSPASNAANIRIQGLQGRYTQLLIDGIPNLSGLSSGLGITQTPPLNLRQIEITKGAGSILYGADAIAGTVNFLTKLPKEESELQLLFNATTQLGQDAVAYYTNTIEGIGLTTLISYNRQSEYDVNNDHFSDVAGYERISVQPQIFIPFSEHSMVKLSLGAMKETRDGGVLDLPDSVTDAPNVYKEHNSSERFSGALQWSASFSDRSDVALNLAMMRLDRSATYGQNIFSGKQTTIYADGQYTNTFGDHSLLFGGALSIDRFTDNSHEGPSSLSYYHSTPGLFAQDEWALSNAWKLLAGVRADFPAGEQSFISPRLSLFYKPVDAVTLRLNGGSGFKTPTPFVEEAEEIGYADIRGLNSLSVETARSISFDCNWRTLISSEVGLSFNAAVFFTRLDHALVPNEDSIDSRILILENATGPTVTTGTEITTQWTYGHFKLLLGYTYTFATQDNHGLRYELELNPRHILSTILMYEDATAGWRAGIENYYIGHQLVDRNPFRSTTPDYSLTGALCEKTIGKVKLFINIENMFDIRQTKFDPTFIGNPFGGSFRLLHTYAPLEGRVINGGLRLTL